jgi:hypothetical protein
MTKEDSLILWIFIALFLLLGLGCFSDGVYVGTVLFFLSAFVLLAIYDRHF